MLEKKNSQAFAQIMIISTMSQYESDVVLQYVLEV